MFFSSKKETRVFDGLQQVRRQRLAEQDLTLKECQQQTEQLQGWLADIALTLDHVTRVNDQSKIQVFINYIFFFYI